jgi:hypothetical protein
MRTNPHLPGYTQLMIMILGDASKPSFKPFASLIKEEKDTTKKVVEKLLQQRSAL